MALTPAQIAHRNALQQATANRIALAAQKAKERADLKAQRDAARAALISSRQNAHQQAIQNRVNLRNQKKQDHANLLAAREQAKFNKQLGALGLNPNPANQGTGNSSNSDFVPGGASGDTSGTLGIGSGIADPGVPVSDAPTSTAATAATSGGSFWSGFSTRQKVELIAGGIVVVVALGLVFKIKAITKPLNDLRKAL